MDAEVGFILHRTVMLAMTASMLAIFGPYALHVLVIVTRALGAGSEIMRDRYIGFLMASRGPASTAGATPSKYRRRRKQR